MALKAGLWLGADAEFLKANGSSTGGQTYCRPGTRQAAAHVMSPQPGDQSCLPSCVGGYESSCTGSGGRFLSLVRCFITPGPRVVGLGRARVKSIVAAQWWVTDSSAGFRAGEC
jgi:hypothetical protein